MDNKVLDAEYNDGVYTEEKRLIQNAAKMKRLVVFVGAGLSIDSGMPSWSAAIQQIRNLFGVDFDEPDLLKVPQYYYNEHGKNNYVALMKKIFKHGKRLQPKENHYKILKFYTEYIITTNYDHLIKEAIYDENGTLDEIVTDKDLAYGIAERKLIKMHGDFEHDNFVLKEEDYLNYDRNFPLIETTIKALIARNVVLFVGYSFGDPDLKHIFSWVKTMLGNDMPQSYIIVTSNKFFPAEENYFKKFGVKILYANKKIKDYLSLNEGQRLGKMLDFLQNKESEKDSLDKVYKYFKPFQEINYVYSRYIKLGLWSQNIGVNDREISPYDEKASLFLQNVVSSEGKDWSTEVERQEVEKYKSVLSVLKKSSIEIIRTDFIEGKHIDKKKDFVPLEAKLPENIEIILEAIYHYDNDTIKKLKISKQSCLINNQPQAYLELAFLSYQLEEYVESYQYLKIAEKLCYQNDMYVWYFISMINRKHLANLIKYNNIENTEYIQDETSNLNLDKVLQSLPSFSNNNEFLVEIHTFLFFYTLFQDVYKKAQEVRNDANTRFSIYGGIPKFTRLRWQIKDVWYYVNANYLIVDYYSEYNNIFKIYGLQILESVLVPDLHKEDSFSLFGFSRNIHPESLNEFDLYIILQHLTLKDIKKIVFHARVKSIPLDAQCQDYLLSIIPKCKKVSRKKNDELFWKIMHIITHSSPTKQVIESMIKELSVNAPNIDVFFYWGDICRFLSYAANLDASLIRSDENEKNLSNYLNSILHDIPNSQQDKNKYNSYILSNGMFLYKKINGEFVSETLDAILSTEYIHTLAYIYHALDQSLKEKISKIACETTWQINDHTLTTIELLARNDIMRINGRMEKDILDYVNGIEDDRKTHSPSRYERTIKIIAILYFEDLLKSKKKFKSIIKKSNEPWAEWIIDTENYDYNKFDLDWLEHCSPTFLKTLKNNEKAWKAIREQVAKEYLNGTARDNILQIYFEHFSV